MRVPLFIIKHLMTVIILTTACHSKNILVILSNNYHLQTFISTPTTHKSWRCCIVDEHSVSLLFCICCSTFQEIPHVLLHLQFFHFIIVFFFSNAQLPKNTDLHILIYICAYYLHASFHIFIAKMSTQQWRLCQMWMTYHNSASLTMSSSG